MELLLVSCALCSESDLINSHKFMSMHVQLISKRQNYSLQVNFEPVLRPRTPSKAEPENEAKLPWKFHEHVPPLNLRTSNRPCCTTGAQLSRLRMFSLFFSAPASPFGETRCISRHVSPLFLNFWNVYTGHEASEWGRETGVHHHPKFTCESEGGKCSVFESGL